MVERREVLERRGHPGMIAAQGFLLDGQRPADIGLRLLVAPQFAVDDAQIIQGGGRKGVLPPEAFFLDGEGSFKKVRGLLEARLIQVEHGQVIEAEGRYSMIVGVQHFLAEGQGFQIDGFGLLVAAQILVYARQEIEVRS